MKDLIIIKGLEQRDKVVFDYVFNYYYSSLCAFSMQYLNKRNEVEDLVQDFFVYLWVEASSLRINSSLKSYLFTAIKNRCLDYQKHHKIIEKYRTFILFSTEKGDDSTDHLFAESELRHAIERSMDKLPPRCREIFEYSRLHGLSNQEISEKLGLSKRTVELQISNSLKVLRKELAEFLPLWLLAWLIG
ncbi:MAG TPA: RNA polymerase sigma-70 factor [Prolixibacteraceae bacterium]